MTAGWGDRRVRWSDERVAWDGTVKVVEPDDPVLDYPRPDVEALVVAYLEQLNPPRSKLVTVWCYTTTDYDQPSPGWLTGVYLQVDVRAKTKEAAWGIADQARRLIHSLPWFDWAGGIVTRVDNVEGPFWLPDPDGCPRYVARYEVRVHPRWRLAQERQPA